MTVEQKLFLEQCAQEIFDGVKHLVEFPPLRCSPPSIEALNAISLAAMKIELEIAKWPLTE